jgi:hypothetical protein
MTITLSDVLPATTTYNPCNGSGGGGMAVLCILTTVRDPRPMRLVSQCLASYGIDGT